MERKEAIRSAYRMTGGNNFYDGMITCSTLSGKAVCRLVWAMNKAENDDYLEKALSGIPEHFSGKLLEVPVGLEETGMILQTILEGLGLGALLVLVCAVGIRKGAVGMVHLYSPEVQDKGGFSSGIWEINRAVPRKRYSRQLNNSGTIQLER